MTGHFLMHVDCEEGTFQDPLVLEAVVGKKKAIQEDKSEQCIEYQGVKGRARVCKGR